jgi:1-acyl-sn-glycerol-3-phosphate acyltransferase
MYWLLKLYARLVIRIYCRRIIINKPGFLQSKGPLLLAANHPNSFLDGIILTTLFDRPIRSLARGDAFQHPQLNRFLRWLNMLPVYRTSEGVQNLGHNYTTFDACHETFEERGIVLIFSEGRCENEWHLRPLKKGTARLATTAWQKGMPLRVLPVGLNYSSFKWFGKTLHLNFGDIISYRQFDPTVSNGKLLLEFNDRLNEQLQKLVYELDEKDKGAVGRAFKKQRPFTTYALLALPALVGWVLHAIFYYPIKFFCDYRFERSGHYDSVLHSLLVLLYPIFLLLFFLVASAYGTKPALVLTLLMPFMAWAWVQFSEVWE